MSQIRTSGRDADLKADEYRCAACGGVFSFGRSDEEAVAEAEALFSEEVQRREVFAVVCDDCFKAMGFDEP